MSSTEEKSTAVYANRDIITTCGICDETYKDPMLLPCAHTFCLTCLQQVETYTDKKPGDQMPCPLCRQEFTIPDDGFAGLEKNFFMERLIEITTTQQSTPRVCKKHEHESLCLYCCDCNEVLCFTCLRECHQEHRLSDVNRAAEILRSQLQNNVCTAKQCLSDVLRKKEVLLQKKISVNKQVEKFETSVLQAREDLKSLINQHADSLLQNLEFLRKERIEDIQTEEKELDKHVDCLKNFEIYCAELASSKRNDSLFCNVASELKEEFVKLRQLNKSIVEPSLNFSEILCTLTAPMTLDAYKTKNIIGEVRAKINYSGKAELVATIGTCSTEDGAGDVISGMAVVNNDVFIVYEKIPVVRIYDSSMRICSTEITLRGFSRKVDLRQCVAVGGNAYIVNWITKEIFRVDRNRDFMKWSTKNDWGRLSVSTESTIVATCYNTNALREYSLQGTLLHEIKLCKYMIHPLHAIKLRNGHFVISHGNFNDSINRVCIVNNTGAITKSFGGQRGVSTQQLDFPICLAADENENILVLDRNNCRVLLLSPDLEFRRELLTKTDQLRRPVAVQLDEKTNRLYIADNNWETCRSTSSDSKVLVFKLR